MHPWQHPTKNGILRCYRFVLSIDTAHQRILQSYWMKDLHDRTQPNLVVSENTFTWRLTPYKQRYHFILSRYIDDQRILQSYWTRGSTGYTKSKIEQLQMEGMEISNYWIMMGDLKKLHINWRVRNNRSVDLKMGGGNPFQSNFGTARYITKLPTFDPMSQKYSVSVFQNWLFKIHFLLHFHVYCFRNNKYEWIKNFMSCIFILSFKSKK